MCVKKNIRVPVRSRFEGCSPPIHQVPGSRRENCAGTRAVRTRRPLVWCLCVLGRASELFRPLPPWRSRSRKPITSPKADSTLNCPSGTTTTTRCSGGFRFVAPLFSWFLLLGDGVCCHARGRETGTRGSSPPVFVGVAPTGTRCWSTTVSSCHTRRARVPPFAVLSLRYAGSPPHPRCMRSVRRRGLTGAASAGGGGRMEFAWVRIRARRTTPRWPIRTAPRFTTSPTTFTAAVPVPPPIPSTPQVRSIGVLCVQRRGCGRAACTSRMRLVQG